MSPTTACVSLPSTVFYHFDKSEFKRKVSKYTKTKKKRRI